MSSFFIKMKCADTVCAFSTETKFPVLTRPISNPQDPFSLIFCPQMSGAQVEVRDGGGVEIYGPSMPALNTKGYSSTDLAMGFANVRAGTQTRRAVLGYPPEH